MTTDAQGNPLKECEFCHGWVTVLMQGFGNLRVCPACRYDMQISQGR